MPACVKSSFDLTCVWRGAMSVLDALPRSAAPQWKKKPVHGTFHGCGTGRLRLKTIL